MMIVILLLLKNGKTKKQLMNIIKQNTLQQLFLKSKALLQNLQEQLNIKRCSNEYIRNNFYKKKCSTIKNQKVDEKDIKTILKAGMSGPTCVNSKDWSFIVVDDPEVLHKMYEANGVPAKPLLECAFAILICGDYSKAFKFSKDYFAVDGSIAGQNMILAAWSLGIGSVWLGTWPQMDRVFAQSKLFDLPNDQIPHSIIAFGYPLDEIKEKEEYYESVVHYNKW